MEFLPNFDEKCKCTFSIIITGKGSRSAKDEIAFDVNSMSLFIQRYLTGSWNLTCTDVVKTQEREWRLKHH